MAEAKPTFVYEDPVHESSRRLMGGYYDQLARAQTDGTPTGYLMISGNCVEILRALDVLPVFPEVNALQMAIRKKSLPLILKAEQVGYASDNCAYVKADLGLSMTGSGNIPKPTVVVCNYVGCNVYIKWFEHVAAYFNAPLYMIDIPFLREKEPLPSDIKYVTEQLRELIALLEKLTGRKLDMRRLSESVAYSRVCEDGWAEAKELCKRRPAPFDAYFDSINMMGPINVLRGTAEAASFFRNAIQAYRVRSAQGRGPLPKEKFRTVVEGPPPYPYYKNFRDLFSRWGAVAVQSTYSTVGGIWEFGFRHDPERPLESIAQQMIVHNLCNRSLVDRYEQIHRYIDEWQADALVIHSVKSCRLFSAGQGDMREYFTRTRSVPVLMLESDLEDPRYYAEAQIKNRIDAFFEALEHRRIAQGVGA